MIYNTVKGEYVPWLGTEFKWSDGDKKLTFTTRDGVKWSDGQPFTAKDVAFTFQLFKDKKGLQGNGSGVWEYLSGVTAPDDKTVEFSFAKVYTVGFFDIATQFIVPQHLWSSIDDPVKFTNETPVATGPFTEVPVFQNQVYEVHKNPNYWQAGKPADRGLPLPGLPRQRPGQPRPRSTARMTGPPTSSPTSRRSLSTKIQKTTTTGSHPPAPRPCSTSTPPRSPSMT